MHQYQFTWCYTSMSQESKPTMQLHNEDVTLDVVVEDFETYHMCGRQSTALTSRLRISSLRVWKYQ